MFNNWLKKIPHNPELNSAVDAVVRFERWLVSFCWLAFYCNKDHAGEHFYSIQLPKLIEVEVDQKEIFPDSSVSIVASEKISDEVKPIWNSFSKELLNNERFKLIRKYIQERFTKFENTRHQRDLPGEEGSLARFVSPFFHDEEKEHNEEKERKQKKESFPVDFRKIEFLLRMSRLLVGQQHEGSPLHFCFIFGFSWERIDSESKGVLQDIISGLSKQWNEFDKNLIQKSVKKKVGCDYTEALVKGKARDTVLSLYAEGMQKWIKTGDLPLQPWDMALFFEETGDKEWPVPTSIVRVCNMNSDYNESIAKEFQLRRALKILTDKSRTTVAVLVGQTGLILFARGKAIILPCNSGIEYNIPFSGVRLWGDRVDEDKFKEFLHERILELVSTRINSSTDKIVSIAHEVCEVIVGLCEALVTLGNGAMIVLRSDSGKLPPLNPVWIVEPEINGPGFKKGILLYALMAALDGATEIRLPAGDGSISFAVRKCVMPDKAIWDNLGDSDYAIISTDFKCINALGLVGKGTRHYNALALSAILKKEAIILTVSADGPVTLWQDGKNLFPPDDSEFQPRFKP